MSKKKLKYFSKRINPSREAGFSLHIFLYLYLHTFLYIFGSRISGLKRYTPLLTYLSPCRFSSIGIVNQVQLVPSLRYPQGPKNLVPQGPNQRYTLHIVVQQIGIPDIVCITYNSATHLQNIEKSGLKNPINIDFAIKIPLLT